MTFRAVVEKVLPREFLDLDSETVLHHLCQLRVETLGVIRHKIRVLVLLFFFTFTLFVTTDGTIALAKTVQNDTAVQQDERLYTVYVLTVIYAVITMVGMIMLFLFSVVNIHKIKGRLLHVHKMFAHGHGYSAIFGVALVFYLMCVVRAIMTAMCELSTNKASYVCATAFQYAGAMNMLFTLLFMLLMAAVLMITEALCKAKIELQTDSAPGSDAVPLMQKPTAGSKLSTAYNKSMS